MKTQFSRRRNSILGGYPWLGPSALLVGVLVLIALLLRLVFPGALTAIASPAWMSGTALTAGVGSAGSFFGDKADLVAERDRLLAENAALTAANATVSARAADLARLLGDRTEPVGGILAGVMVRPPVSPYDVLIVDAGSEDGVVEGSQAAGPGSIPLGTVESVTGGTSRIALYSASGQETESWIGEARIPVTLMGEGSGALRAIVAREAGIVEGDLVYVTGPGAVAIGSVVRVENDPSSPRSRIDIRPLVNPFSVTWVTIAP